MNILKTKAFHQFSFRIIKKSNDFQLTLKHFITTSHLIPMSDTTPFTSEITSDKTSTQWNAFQKNLSLCTFCHFFLYFAFLFLSAHLCALNTLLQWTFVCHSYRINNVFQRKNWDEIATILLLEWKLLPVYNKKNETEATDRQTLPQRCTN